MTDEPTRNLFFPDSHTDADRLYLSSPQLHEALPDGSIVDGFVMVIAFSDQQGERRWGLHFKADLPITTAVGIMELAKLELIARTPGVVTHLSADHEDGGE